MKPYSFQYNYHDGLLMGFTLGPRRELILDVLLDSVWNKHSTSANVRFGAIENFDQVSSFFGSLPKPQAGRCIAEIEKLVADDTGGNAVLLKLERLASLRIESSKISET